IINTTNRYARNWEITLEIEAYEQRFEELLIKLYEKTGQEIVLLVDEYDKPILDNLFNDKIDGIKQVMNRFYATLKSMDRYLRFTFITGVSKFAKISVFSGMNHLSDISMDAEYATLCGITQEELESHFGQAVDELAKKEHLDRAQTLAKIKYWYNGYQFEEDAPGVYNPFSLLSLFRTAKFNNYWFTTATPTFLLDLLQNKQYDLKNLTAVKVGVAAFDASNPHDMDILSLFVQTGYLTIKSYRAPQYQLGFPNYEVKKSFFDSVAARYAQISPGAGQNYTFELTEAIQADDLGTFFKILKIFFANIPYDITLQHEKYYQSLFYALFKLIGLTIEAEVRTNQGRIDCVVQNDNTIYIIEFKLNGTKEQALQQIHDKNYAQKYQGSDKKVVLLGVEFDKDSRNIGEYIVG
ncbi:MAG: ATP-binding protein, partial [Psychrosphaera sp.]|nr:ATP-binding protein [Psychrosphaera sp.]